MRVLMCGLVVALAVGCEKRATTSEASNGPASQPELVEAPKVRSSQPIPDVTTPVAFTGTEVPIIKDYFKNRINADGKYLDKRVRIETRVDVVGRTKDGNPYIGTVFVTDLKRTIEPSLMFIFPESDISVAKLKKGDLATIEGVCRGRIDDGVSRSVTGYEFHIKVEGCVLRSTEAMK